MFAKLIAKLANLLPGTLAEPCLGPRTTLPGTKYTFARAVLEGQGVIFSDKWRDRYQVYAWLPLGWKKIPSLSRSEKLVDDKGRTRAIINRIDGAPILLLTNRFYVAQGTDRNDAIICHVMDGGKIIYTTPIRDMTSDRHLRDERYQVAFKEADAWLEAHYPDHDNPSAYWD